MQKKKLIIVIPELCIGGVSSSLRGLFGYIPFERYDVTLLLFSEESELLSTLPEQVKLEYDTTMARLEQLRGSLSKILQSGPFRALFHICKKVYHRFGQMLFSQATDRKQVYDVAIAYQDGLATWYVAEKVSATQKIAFVHTDFAMAQYYIPREEKIYSAFSQICFGSKASQDSFLSCMPQFAKCSICVPNAVDFSNIRAKANENDGFTDDFDGLRILTVGRLSHEKGSYKIPLIIKRLRNTGVTFRWYLIGDGPLRENLLQAGCEELVLLGLKSNPYPFLKQCDIYVQPSNYEGYCIALAEARALHRPIVTCDFSGASEQILNGVTGIITGFDAADIYEGVKTALENKDLRDKFSKELSLSCQGEDYLIHQWIDSL